MELWSFRRWVKESKKYMQGEYPWYKFYYLAIRKWPSFNRQQKEDMRLYYGL